jgi:F0F1-type ATP synthase membrane subunit c/vacuolar-type H+-ATPase subunit K
MPETPEKAHRVTVILWGAMFAALGLYYLVITTVQPDHPDLDLPLIKPLLGAAVLCVTAALVLRRRMNDTPARIRAGYIVAFALCEAAALFGVITHFTTAWPNAWIFFVIAAVGFALNFPQRADFDQPRP